MAVFGLFPKRKLQAARTGDTDVYQYNALPDGLRVQICHIWRDSIGVPQSYDGDENEAAGWWKFIHDGIAREKGIFALYPQGNHLVRCREWFLRASVDDALDIIELSFRVIDRGIRSYNDYKRQQEGLCQPPDEAIEELNQRFREHAVGYQLVGGHIIRVDNQYVHAELVKPALELLGAPGFEKASEDFQLAHHHNRDGNHKDCVVACQRAFESALKAVGAINGWPFGRGDRATDLIKVIRREGLFPGYLDAGLDTYIAMLKTGLPEVRNNAGGHGEAPDAASAPSYIASYALHMTAANVLMVCDAQGHRS